MGAARSVQRTTEFKASIRATCFGASHKIAFINKAHGGRLHEYYPPKKIEGMIHIMPDGTTMTHEEWLAFIRGN